MVRPFQENDAGACFEIILEAITTMDGLNEAARAHVASNNDAGTVYEELSGLYSVVFEEQGRIFGLGALDGKEIKRLYIAPQAQGRGVGSAILQALEHQARQRPSKILEAKASPSSVSFYEKFGYKKVRPGCYHTGEAAFHYVVMRKAL